MIFSRQLIVLFFLGAAVCFVPYSKTSDSILTVVKKVEGDPLLSNPYDATPVNPARHPHVRYQLALRFAKWPVSNKGQKLIEGYKLHGQQLFFPDGKSLFPERKEHKKTL